LPPAPVADGVIVTVEPAIAPAPLYEKVTLPVAGEVIDVDDSEVAPLPSLSASVIGLT
jgi:hypothetical protein